MKIGKYIIGNWEAREYYRMRDNIPIQYYYVRSVKDSTVGIVEDAFILKLSNPWGSEGIINPNLWLFGFDYEIKSKINYHDATNAKSFFYNSYMDMYPKSARLFKSLRAGKIHVNKFLNRLNKLKAFL